MLNIIPLILTLSYSNLPEDESCFNNPSYHIIKQDPDRKEILIIDDMDTIIRSFIPNDLDLMGFSIEKLHVHNDTMVLSVEYGSRYYYYKEFVFKCVKSDVFMVAIKSESFDKADPDKTYLKATEETCVSVKDFILGKYLE